MAIALLSDLRVRRIPNWLTVGGLAVALVVRAASTEVSVVDGGLGAGVGLLLALPLFLVGAFGGGDAKLVATVGAFTGASGLGAALLATMVSGGVIALVLMVRKSVLIPAILRAKDLALHAVTVGRRGEASTLQDAPESMKIPFGAAIALGSAVAWLLPLMGGIP